ncbi:MAG: hypothetical protein IJQ05_01660 [Bacteroidaceae bacterium]|nr:hypothetical protein [Bacteroidaceae bacterium]
MVGLTAPFDFSYKFKIGEFSISPITGPTLGWIHEMVDWSTRTYDDFVFGWDFGGRVAYKNFTLSYCYNKGISGDYWNTHQLAVGYIFKNRIKQCKQIHGCPLEFFPDENLVNTNVYT